MENLIETKHSRLGIASFALSIAVAILMLALLAIAGILKAHHREGAYPGQMLVGFLLIALMFADMVAASLGVAAICETGKKKVLGLLGLFFSSVTIVGTIGLILLGLKIAGKL